MKVIHLISGGDTGGARTHVLSLLNLLHRSIDAELICITDGPLAQDAIQMGIPTRIMSSGNILKVYRQVKAHVAQNGFEIIHCHGSRANMLGVFLKRSVKLPVITTVHSDYRLDYLGRLFHRLTYGTINTISLRLLDYHVGVSDTMTRLLIDRGFTADKVFPIYNGIDFSHKTPELTRGQYLDSLGVSYDGGTVVFAIVARLSAVKDVGTLIRGFAEAERERPNIRLIIAGVGEQEQMLRELARELNVAEKIAFAGWVSDMTSFYGAIDVNTLTSLSETFPYALTEGARASCATISSNVGGVPALIDDGRNGLLFPPGDHHTLARHMLTLAGDRDLRERLGGRLYEKASKVFSIESTRDRQLEIYETILRREKRPKGRRDGVLICGAYGKGNIGDDAILEAIILQMRQIDLDMPIYVLSRQPKQTSSVYAVRSFYTFNFLKCFQIMRKTRLYLNGGGSLIQDITSTRSLYYYLLSIFLARISGNKVLMYGCGIGPVQKPFNRRMASRIINRNVHRITLREDHSKAELEAMGAVRPEIKVTADPALILPPAQESEVRGLMLRSGIPDDGKYICFALRPWKDFDEKIPVFASAADYAYREFGLTPVFLPIEPAKDLPAMEKVAALLDSPYYVISSVGSGPMAIGLLRRMDLLVSMRLHALVFAAGQGVPLVGAVYDHKVSAFLRYIGQELYTQLDSITAEALCGHIAIAVKSAGNTQAQKAAVERLRSLERGNTEAARALLEEL